MKKVTQAFVAIKMKIRFRNRFYRKMGYSFDERIRKQVKRGLTYGGLTMFDQYIERAKRVITDVIAKIESNKDLNEKVKKYVIAGQKIKKFLFNRKTI